MTLNLPFARLPRSCWRQMLLVLALAGVLAWPLAGARQARAESSERPNIVVILADDMGYGDVHAYNGASTIPTPNLDRLAGEGMRFSDGHSPSAVCTPTRYALLTGRYCWRSSLKRGVLGGYSPPLLETSRQTIASMLKASGYRTGAVGKWHLGMQLPTLGDKTNRTTWEGDPGIDFGGKITDSPIHHGFDTYFGVSASLDMAPYVYIRDDRFTMKPSIQQPKVNFPHFVRQGPRAEDFVIDEVLDRLADEAMKHITESAKGDKPFFLYLPLTAPHKPTQPHERFRGKTKLGEYGDFIVQVDDTVGRVLKSLQQAGVADNTLVFYTSDNGSYMQRLGKNKPADHVTDSKQQGYYAKHHRANGPLRGTKADVWEAGHRVPLIVRWPGKVQSGSTCEQTVCLTDIYATCAEVVGAEIDDEDAPDSFSLAPLLAGKQVARGAPVIHHSAAGMFAIRDGKWKLVAGNGSGGRQAPKGKPFAKPFQLFDLEADLAEENNVAEANPQVVERLTDRLEQLRSRGRSR